jgi:ABC-type multidrug transport system ATPase subunit
VIRKEIIDLQHFIGFVPQDDVLDRNLTVRELLTLNASIRQPRLTSSEIADIVNDVMIDLHIRHVADTIIGGSANTAANVSGGQLKRINIAMELVSLTRPALLLLDEPTSGLDAAIANELFENLYHLSRSGITIIAALQQPRQEIFERMDNVILMSLGGHIVYDGPPKLAAVRLVDHGYQANPISADADFCLDVLNGNIDVKDDHRKISSINQEETYGLYDEIISSWNLESSRNLSAYQAIKSSIIHPDDEGAQTNKAMSMEEIQLTLYLYIRESYLHGQRALLVRLRNWVSLCVYAAVQIIMAVALASGFSIYFANSYLSTFTPPALSSLTDYFPSLLVKRENRNVFDFGLAQLLFFMSATLGLASALTAVPLFAGKQALIKRESLAGMSVSAYSVGAMIADSIIVYWNALIYAALWMMFAPVGHWYDWHAAIVCIAFASSGWGYFASLISTGGSSSFVSLIITLIFCVFSGVDPTLKQVQSFPIVNWPWYLSFATWTSEIVYYTVSQYLQNQNDDLASRVRVGARQDGFQVTDIAKPVIALLGLGFLARAASLLAVQRLRARQTRKLA